MNLQQIRWPVVVIVMAAVLGGLFGAGYLLKSQTVDQPLNTFLAKAGQVESYTVQQTETTREIRVRFKATTDLKSAYRELDHGISQILPSAPYDIKVEDMRTPELTQTADRIDLYVYEALATGQFAAMADRVEAEAQKVGATARVGVDNDRVYVSLIKGDGYLYTVVNRTVEQPLRQEGGLGL